MFRIQAPIFLSLLTVALAVPPVAAQKANTPDVADPTELALESLFNMQVTTASKFPEKLSSAPSVMSVVTQDELRRFGAMTLREALERVPGLLAATSYFSERSVVGVRGDQLKATGGHVLILIDGRPVREILEGGIISDLLQSFPVNLLERIEVIRGPGSVLYGSNAFSGVINLIPKKAFGSSATFRTYSAGAGTGGGSGELFLERGKLNVAAAGQVRFDPTRRTEYWFKPNDSLAGSQPAFRQSLPLRDQGPGAYLGVNYKGFRFLSAYTEWESNYALSLVLGENRWRRGFANLGYTFAAAANWEMSFDLTHSRTGFFASSIPNIKRASSDTVFEWTNVVRPTNRDQITFGALDNYIQGQELFWAAVPATPVSQGTRNAIGFYAQLDHQVSDSLKLVVGFQSNRIGVLDLNTVPRAGVVWSPASRVHVKALYGRAFRAPSLNETGVRHPLLTGNPNLAPEEVGTFDLGVSYQANRILAGVNYFHSRQSGIVVPDTSRFPLVYQNLGSVRISGLEFEAKRYFTERWFAHGSLLYNRAEGPQPAGSPNWVASGGVSYQARKAFTVSLLDVYSGEAPAPRVTLNPAPAAHHVVNTHGRLELARIFGEGAKHLSLFAHGNNLLNSKVWVPDGDTRIGDTLPFRLGRTLYYGIEVALFRE